MSEVDPEEHRRRIWAMKPEDRAALAALIRRERDKIPDEIERLRQQMVDSNAWLDEFDPGRDIDSDQPSPGDDPDA